MIIPVCSFAQTIYWKKDHVYAGGKEIAVITPAPADQTAPTVPTGLAASTVTATSVQLSWNAASDTGSGVAGYKVYRQMGSGASLPVGTTGSSTTSFTDQPLQPGAGYTYTVRAFDFAQNHSAGSSGVTITTLTATDTTAPTTPTGLTAFVLPPTRNTIRLIWNRSIDSGGSGVAGYRVYRSGVLASGTNAIPNPTFDDAGLSFNRGWAYVVTAVDNAGNNSAGSNTVIVSTDRELLVQDNFNRQDGTLTSPWSVALGAATYMTIAGSPYCEGTYCWDLSFTSATIDHRLLLSGLRLAPAASYNQLGSYYNAGEYWEVGWWVPYVWSQAALQPSTMSFKASLDVATNTSAAGLILYAQAATGNGVNHGGGGTTYSSSRGFRAILQNGSVLLQNCLDLNYLDDPSSVCTTVGSASGVLSTGTISVETNASTGSVKVYVNGTLKITSTVSTSLMTGAVGMTTLGRYSLDRNGYPSIYTTATVDNFLLERN